jgi:hypothetical protein
MCCLENHPGDCEIHAKYINKCLACHRSVRYIGVACGQCRLCCLQSGRHCESHLQVRFVKFANRNITVVEYVMRTLHELHKAYCDGDMRRANAKCVILFRYIHAKSPTIGIVSPVAMSAFAYGIARTCSSDVLDNVEEMLAARANVLARSKNLVAARPEITGWPLIRNVMALTRVPQRRQLVMRGFCYRMGTRLTAQMLYFLGVTRETAPTLDNDDEDIHRAQPAQAYHDALQMNPLHISPILYKLCSLEVTADVWAQRRDDYRANAAVLVLLIEVIGKLDAICCFIWY